MNLVEMVVESTHMPLMGYRKRLALSEKHGSRTLAIWINQLDAEAISALFRNDTPSTEIYTLPLRGALPLSCGPGQWP